MDAMLRNLRRKTTSKTGQRIGERQTVFVTSTELCCFYSLCEFILCDNVVMIQDDSREKTMLALCGLSGASSRMSADDGFDADDNPFQLKSTSREKWISLARSVGFSHIEKWRHQYWIIGYGDDVEDDGPKRFCFTEMYIAHPTHLEPRFTELEKRLQYRQQIAEEAYEAAKRNGMGSAKLRKLEEVHRRGITLNDPSLSMKLVRKRCPPIDVENPVLARVTISTFVSECPLNKPVPLKKFLGPDLFES